MNLRKTLVASVIAMLSVCAAIAQAGTYSDAVNALNPDHYYRLNETVADTANPTVLDTGTATAINGIHYGTWTGLPDGAEVNVSGPNLPGFDASNGAILHNDAGVINLGDGANLAAENMTVAFWMRTPSNSWDGVYADRVFENNAPSTAGGLSVNLWNGETGSEPGETGLVVAVHSGNGQSIPNTAIDLLDDRWHHVVVVRNGNSATDAQVIIDGVDYTSALTDATEGFGATGTTAWIGTRDFDSNRGNYLGSTDEVAVWLDRALTVEEAQGLYAAAVPEPTALALVGLGLASLFALWRRP